MLLVSQQEPSGKVNYPGRLCCPLNVAAPVRRLCLLRCRDGQADFSSELMLPDFKQEPSRQVKYPGRLCCLVNVAAPMHRLCLLRWRDGQADFGRELMLAAFKEEPSGR